MLRCGKRYILLALILQLGIVSGTETDYSISFNYMDGYASSDATSETIFQGVTSFSVEVWYKNPGVINGPNSSLSGNSNIITNYRRMNGGDPYNNFDLSMGSPISTSPGYSTFLGTQSNELMDDDQWHHFAGVYDNDNGMAYLYIDGVLNDSISTSGDFLSSYNKLYINTHAPFAGEYHMECGVAGVRITNGVRYTNDFTPAFPLESEANSIIALDFTSGSGSTVTDLSGNGNDFTLYDGATWSTDVPGPFQPADKTELQTAVDLWVSDNSAALSTYGEINTWDVSLITDMSSLFYDKQTFNEDLDNWDVSNVTDMRFMFQKAYDFNGDISTWDVSGVTSMDYMFFKAYDFNGDISNWNMSSVTVTRAMLRECGFNGDISNWDVSNVTDFWTMFANNSVFNQDISSWDLSSAVTLSEMFYFATSFNQDISSWDILNASNMNYMLDETGLSDENKCAIHSSFSSNSNWPYDWSESCIFQPADKTELQTAVDLWVSDNSAALNTYGEINTWDVSLITDMSDLFKDQTFNSDISDWDVSNVTNMIAMFRYSTFNQDIGDWDVSNVTEMNALFMGTSFNHDIGDWNVSSVTNLTGTFQYNTIFNQDISGWDVSNVWQMRETFKGSSGFDQDISGWDVSNVTDWHETFWTANNNATPIPSLSDENKCAIHSAWSAQNATWPYDWSDMCYSGPTWYVSTYGSDAAGNGSSYYPFASIQTAINSAADYDTIYVAAGTYYESIYYQEKNLFIYGAGSDSTTIDAQFMGHTVDISRSNYPGSYEVLSGFTLTGGEVPDSTNHYYGGGLFIQNADPYLLDLVITGNTGNAAAIYAYRSNFVLEDSWIKNNEENYNSEPIQIGGVSTPIFRRVRISDETCFAPIRSFHGNLLLENCLISGNTSTYLLNVNTQGTMTLLNSTVTGNSISSYNGDIYMVSGSTALRIINSIFWGNSGESGIKDKGGDIAVSHSNVYGGKDTVLSSGGNIYWHDGNTDVDPQFSDPDNEDYSLSETSPLISGGAETVTVRTYSYQLGNDTVSTQYFAPGRDLAGNSRPMPSGSMPDMGAYENAAGLIVVTNTAPIANDTTYSVSIDSFLHETMNSYDADGDTLFYYIIDYPYYGSAWFSSDTLTYYPLSPVGDVTDSLTYAAWDGMLMSDTATIWINLTDENSTFTEGVMHPAQGDTLTAGTTDSIEVYLPGATIPYNVSIYLDYLDASGSWLSYGPIDTWFPVTGYGWTYAWDIPDTMPENDYQIWLYSSDGNVNTYGGAFYIEAAETEAFSGPVFHVSTTGDDATGDGSSDYPFGSIQTAIDASSDGDTVLVNHGWYVENVNYNGKNIIVASLYLTTGDTSHISQTIIDGNQDSSVVTFENDEDSTAVLCGFTIQNGTGNLNQYNSAQGGGVHVDGASPILKNLIVKNNAVSSGYSAGGGMFLSNSQAVISHSLITGNSAIYLAGGIYLSGGDVTIQNVTLTDNSDTYSSHDQDDVIYVGWGATATLRNVIIWDNSPNDIRVGGNSTLNMSYSNIEGGQESVEENTNAATNWGAGNIDADPLFTDPDIGDYTLQYGSPAIDAGDPNSEYDPDGTIADMGAYYFDQTGIQVQEENFSLSFDGVDDYVDLLNTSFAVQGNNPRSVLFWVKNEAFVDWYTTADNSQFENMFATGTAEPWNKTFNIKFTQENTIGVMGYSNDYWPVSSDINITDGDWHFVSVTFDGSNLKIYVDGSLKHSTTKNYNTEGQNNYFGKSNHNTAGGIHYFDGNLDDISAWDISLSEAEIQSYMEFPPSGSESNLVGYWDFNEGSGTSAGDGSGNGNDGTVSGASWSTDVPSADNIDFIPTDIPIDVYAPTGLTWDGKNYWVPGGWATGNSSLEYIFKLDPETGAKVDSVPTPSDWTGGLTWDGVALWANAYPSLAAVDTSDGNINSTISARYSPGWAGMAWDGEHLYYGTNGDNIANYIYMVDPAAGTYEDSLNLGLGTNVRINGLTWDGAKLWYSDGLNKLITAVSMDGTVHESVHAPGDDPGGLTMVDGVLMNLDRNDNMIYVVNMDSTVDLNYAPDDFALIEPSDSSEVFLDFQSDDDTLWFSWEESFDPNDDSLTYFFSGLFYAEDGTLDTLKGIDTLHGRTDYDISYSQLNEWLDSLGVSKAVLQWNVEATDGIVGNDSENGPFHVMVEYLNTPSDDFALIEPSDSSEVFLDFQSDDDTLWFSWEESFDPNDDSLTYFFSGLFYAEDGTLDTLKGIDTLHGRTDYDISYSQLNEWLDSLGVSKAVLQWNVEATDGIVGNDSENGPFYVMVEYLNTPPNDFSLSLPSDDFEFVLTAQSVISGSQELFSWNPASDPDGDEISYEGIFTLFADTSEFEYAENSSDTSIVLDHALLSSWLDSLGVTAATMNWKVFAIDGTDSTESNEFHVFVDGTEIVNDPPSSFSLTYPDDHDTVNLYPYNLDSDTLWFGWDASEDEETDSLNYTIDWMLYDSGGQSDTLFEQDVQPENWTWISYNGFKDGLDSLGIADGVLEWNVSVSDGNNMVVSDNGPRFVVVNGEEMNGRPNLRIHELSTPHHVGYDDWEGDFVDFTVVNDGDADADSFTVEFYISEDSILTTDDTPQLDSRTYVNGLAAGDTARMSFFYANLHHVFDDGIFYFGPIIDVLDNVQESNEDDNFWRHYLRIGNPEFSLSFDGDGDYVNFGDPEDGSLDFDADPFSYTIWAKTTSPDFQQILSKRGEGGSYEMQMSGGYVSADYVNATTMISDGDWHHIAYTWSGDSAKLYIDGTLESVGAPEGGDTFSASSDGALHVGADTYQGEWFTGNLDNFRIWNRELESSEIRPNMYFHPHWDEDLQPVGYWPLNEGLGDSAYSWTERELNGEIIGASWSDDVPPKPEGIAEVSISSARPDSGYIWVGLWFPGSDFETRGPDIGRDSVYVNFADSSEHTVYFTGLPDGDGYVVRSIFDVIGSATGGTDECDEGEDLLGETDPFSIDEQTSYVDLVLDECAGPNNPPYWTGLPSDTTYAEDDTLTLDFSDYAFDDDPEDSLSFHVLWSTDTLDNMHWNIIPGTTLIEFYADPDSAGYSESYVFYTEDPQNFGARSDTITISVYPVEDAPVILSGGFYEITVDSYFSYLAEGHDADGDSLSWDFTNLPEWLSTDADSVYGTPTEGGTVDTFWVHVSDGILADSMEVTVSVIDLNSQPIVGLDLELREHHNGVPFAFSMLDLEDDSMTYSFYYSMDSLEWTDATVSEVPPARPEGPTLGAGKYNSAITLASSGRERTDFEMEWDSRTDLGDTHAFEIWFKASVTDGRLTTNKTTGSFSVDNFIGSVWFDSFPTGEVSGTLNMSYTLSDPSNDAYTMTLEYSTDGGSTWMEPTLNSPISDPLLPSEYIGTLTWNTETDLANSDEQVLLGLSITDGWEYGFADTVEFTVDNQELISLVSYAPDTSAQVNWYDNFILFFPGEVDEATLESGITLEGSMTGAVAASYNIANIGTQVRLSIIPDETLYAGESVTLTISTDVTDTLGNPFDGNMNGDQDGDLDIAVLEYETALLGDYDYSGLVEFSDLLGFQQAWWDPSTYGGRETGPAEGSAPNLKIQSDGAIDFEDLMVFVQMWNWSAGFVQNDGWIANARTAGESGISIETTFPKKQLGNDIESLYLNIYVDSLLQVGAGEVLISYDPYSLEFKKASASQIGNWIVLASASEPGLLRINLADFNTELPVGSALANIEFRTLQDMETSISWQADLRTRSGESWGQGSGQTEFSTVPPLPIEFALHQNFPNPFNPTTTIQYDLPEDSRIRLTVYDIQGREVYVISDGVQPAGFRSVIWNGKDAHGIPASAGMYFLRLDTPSFHDTRKMILLK